MRDYKTLYRQIGVEFNTGFAAILILMHYPVKEIVVKGFTFFLGGDSYNDLFCEGHMDEIDIKGRKFGFSGGHGMHANMHQMQCFKIMYKSDNRVVVDDMLMSALGLER